MVHYLKTLPEYFQSVKIGIKNFEIRKNDRNFQIGDELALLEYTPQNGFTGDYIIVEVIYMTNYEQKDGYVVMGIERRENNG